MRKLSLYIMIFGLLLVGVGCDGSSNDDSNDGDVFVGNWSLNKVEDQSGDRTDVFDAGISSVVIGFESDGGFSLNVDAVLDEADANYTGEYGIIESNSTVSISIDVNGTDFPLAFTYDIVNDSQIKLMAASGATATLAFLFDTSLNAPVTITLVKG